MPSDRPGEHLRSCAGSPSVRWLLGLALITLGSWGRWLATGSLRIDENYPEELPGSLLFATLVLGWVLVVTAWVGLLERPPERPRQLAYGGLAIVAFMLPLLSNDLYGLFAYAGLAVRGHDVYTSTQSLSASPWFLWIGERWRANPCPYGPLALLSAAWPSIAGEKNAFLAVFLLRLTWFIPLLAVMELSLRAFADRPFFQAMLWLNPLLLVEGVGQLHLDLLGALALTAGLILQSTAGRLWGAMGWAAATLLKWNDVLAGPWFWLAGAPRWGQRLKSLALMAVVLVGMTAAAYLPFWRGAETVREPFRALFVQTLVPGGSVVDGLGELGNALRGEQGDHFDPDMPVVERAARQREARASLWHAAQALMWVVALAALLPLVLRSLRLRAEEELALGGGTFIIILLTLASPKFESWYLMSALPFFGCACPPVWRRWWPWMVFAAVSKEFPLALPRSALLFKPAVGLTTGLSVAVCLLAFRQRFWRWPALHGD
jgi:hypothetical protein